MTEKKYTEALRPCVGRGMVVVGALWHVLFRGSALCNLKALDHARALGVTLAVPVEPQIT